MGRLNVASTQGRRANALDQRHIERRELTGRRLLPAIERLLETESYAEISVEELVNEASISRSTFYNYFEDKGDLLRTLTADVMSAIIDATRAWWMLPPQATKQDLREAIVHMVEIHAPHSALMRAVADSTSQDPRVREEFHAYMAHGADGIASYIRAGQEAGHFRQDIDAQRTAQWLDWMAERGLSQLSLPGTRYDHDRMVTALTDVIWKATH